MKKRKLCFDGNSMPRTLQPTLSHSLPQRLEGLPPPLAWSRIRNVSALNLGEKLCAWRAGCAPDDYAENERKLTKLKQKITDLQKKLDEKTVEPIPPADYEETKKQLAELQANYDKVSENIDVAQKLDAIYSLITDIIYSPHCGRALVKCLKQTQLALM